MDAYREAVRGFKEVSRHRVVAEIDMEGDVERGRRARAELRARRKPQLIFAVGVWALQAVAADIRDVPVVYAWSSTLRA